MLWIKLRGQVFCVIHRRQILHFGKLKYIEPVCGCRKIATFVYIKPVCGCRKIALLRKHHKYNACNHRNDLAIPASATRIKL